MRGWTPQGSLLLLVALPAFALLAAAQPPLTPTESRVVFATCRDHQDQGTQLNRRFAQEVESEINYKCSDAEIDDQADRRWQRAEHQAALQVVAEYKAASGAQCPSTAAGTTPAVKAVLKANYPAAVFAAAANYAEDDFRTMVQGLAWPVVGGGPIGETRSLEVFTKPTLQDYITDFMTGGRIPHPFGSDSKAIVAAFQAPAPRTQAAFLFHATETLNPCMWATDFDQSQVDFAAFPGQPPCLNCKVHKGFLRAFDSVTDTNNATYNIAAVWQKLTGVPASAVTSVLCAGHSLGAAMAVLCGPWARSKFPNAVVQVVTSGGPRVFDPNSAAWYETLMGESAVRFVNNMDVVPSVPFANNLFLGTYKHVGSPIWLDRTGEFMPGNYTAFAQNRPAWYTGSSYDHHGYIMAIKQALLCNPAF